MVHPERQALEKRNDGPTLAREWAHEEVGSGLILFCPLQLADAGGVGHFGSAGGVKLERFGAREFGFDAAGDFRADGGMAKAVEDFLEKAQSDEVTGDAIWDAAGTHVEQFLGVDLPGGGTMRAFDVVVEDFQSRQGIGLSLGVEKEVAVGLIGVGLAGSGIDADEALEDGAGAEGQLGSVP
jgi:hypothetical protein